MDGSDLERIQFYGWDRNLYPEDLWHKLREETSFTRLSPPVWLSHDRQTGRPRAKGLPALRLAPGQRTHPPPSYNRELHRQTDRRHHPSHLPEPRPDRRRGWSYNLDRLPGVQLLHLRGIVQQLAITRGRCGAASPEPRRSEDQGLCGRHGTSASHNDCADQDQGVRTPEAGHDREWTGGHQARPV